MYWTHRSALERVSPNCPSDIVEALTKTLQAEKKRISLIRENLWEKEKDHGQKSHFPLRA